MGYSITAQNASGCISSATTGTMGAQPMTPNAPTVSITQPSCTNASGSVTITSGTTGLTFSTDGINYYAYTAPYTVAANTGYSITARNASGCISSATAGTMGSQPTTPATPTISVTQPTCTNANGYVAITLGTTGSKTFSTDGVNYAAYTGPYTVAAGAGYSITAKNLSGCVSSPATGTMGLQPQTPSTPSISLTQPTCTNANGMVAITSNTTGLTFSTDGVNYNAYTAPYTVAANMGYSITAENASGCVSTATTGTMGAQPITPDAPTVSVIEPTCSDNNGYIAITSNTTGLTLSTNGVNYNPYTAPYAIAANTEYSITAQNGSGCISLATIGLIVPQPQTPAAPTVSLIQPTCSDNNGYVAITSSTSGLTLSTDGINYFAYTAPYAVVANTGFSITAENASGCISMPTIGTMGAQPQTPATPMVSVTQPTCNNANGLVAITSNTTGLTFSTDGVNYNPYTTPYTVAANIGYSITSRKR